MVNTTRISFEFFPVKTEKGVHNFEEQAVKLAKCHPEYSQSRMVRVVRPEIEQLKLYYLV